LRSDPRLLGLAALADEPLVYRRGEGDGVAVIYKHPDLVEGLGDLPWHRDCGMGGHAVTCPTAIASVFLTDGTPGSGELLFLPGSRHAAFNAHDPQCAARAGRVPTPVPRRDLALWRHGARSAAPTEPDRSGTGSVRSWATAPDGLIIARKRATTTSCTSDDGRVERLSVATRR
jgi:hypothetical protein